MKVNKKALVGLAVVVLQSKYVKHCTVEKELTTMCDLDNDHDIDQIVGEYSADYTKLIITPSLTYGYFFSKDYTPTQVFIYPYTEPLLKGEDVDGDSYCDLIIWRSKQNNYVSPVTLFNDQTGKLTGMLGDPDYTRHK